VKQLRQPKVKAWLDVKGLCVLPLGAGALPTTTDELVQGLTDGYSRALRLPDPTHFVAADGARFPALNSLRIDLSDGTMDLKKKADKTAPLNKPERHLAVGQFDLVGQPLLCFKSKLNLAFSATGARMDVDHDRKGRAILLLAEARKGSLSIEMTTRDIERLIKSAASEAAAPYAVSIVGTQFALDADNDRSLSVRLHLSTKVGFIPAGLTFSAHVDIDDAMNAKLSDLKCDGDDVLGPLITNFLRPGLAKYEGKTRPLVSFPSTSMRLHDFSLKVGDSVRLTATFGRV
jgi:hypothetical protein